MEHIDITPTWAGILPALLAVLEDGTSADARAVITAELARMARLADAVGPLLAFTREAADMGHGGAIRALQAFELQVAP